MTSSIQHYKKLQSPCRVKFLEELISLLLSPLLLSVLRHVDSFVDLLLSQPGSFFALPLNLSQTSNDYFLSYVKLSLSFCLKLADTDPPGSLVELIHHQLLFPANSRVRNREISMLFCLKGPSEKSRSHLHYLERMKYVTRKSRTCHQST